MNKNPTILVTGGAGYIGSHTCVLLLEAGYQVVVVDNLSNSKSDSLSRIEEMTGRETQFHLADLRNAAEMKDLFDDEQIDAVIHFAGLKAVGESVEKPLDYYQNNVGGTANLLEEMNRHGVKNIVFSSSCTVYGAPDSLPIREDFPLQAMSPYGQTKLSIEYMLKDLAASDPDWNISLLRYFNPVGAHPGGEIGEDPQGIPNNLMPYITKVAVGELDKLSVFGADYDTPDGTCIRDYIHVMDLAEAHLAALRKLEEGPGLMIHNLGTGQGCSVLDIVQGFETATGLAIPHEIVARRPGDVPAVYADPSLAQRELGWSATRGLEDMCRDAWNWQRKNPKGYD
ncbi:MAG: UDP-glucose 4-epimerase GalE [Gammaproteobacteria bacterium]|nr:UDP-glucose 4-epimerase GalE [Gammaproteobacteria bacterium]